jgi:hypothetical protein
VPLPRRRRLLESTTYPEINRLSELASPLRNPIGHFCNRVAHFPDAAGPIAAALTQHAAPGSGWQAAGAPAAAGRTAELPCPRCGACSVLQRPGQGGWRGLACLLPMCAAPVPPTPPTDPHNVRCAAGGARPQVGGVRGWPAGRALGAGCVRLGLPVQGPWRALFVMPVVPIARACVQGRAARRQVPRSGGGGRPHHPGGQRRRQGGARALCALPHRLPTRRRRSHRAVQLAVRQEHWRQAHPAGGGHGCGAQHPRV